MKTLGDRLDDACARFGTEWVVLPFEETREAWRHGPYWCALMLDEKPPQEGRRRHFRYNGNIITRERWPDPRVVFIDFTPRGSRGARRALLAEIESWADVTLQ